MLSCSLFGCAHAELNAHSSICTVPSFHTSTSNQAVRVRSSCCCADSCCIIALGVHVHHTLLQPCCHAAWELPHHSTDWEGGVPHAAHLLQGYHRNKTTTTTGKQPKIGKTRPVRNIAIERPRRHPVSPPLQGFTSSLPCVQALNGILHTVPSWSAVGGDGEPLLGHCVHTELLHL